MFKKTYTLAQIRQAVQESGLTEVAAYDDLDIIPATDASDRVTMVVR